MDIGLLILINFITIPFLYETELLGMKLKRFPSLLNILSLTQARKTRWLKIYCIFLAILTATAFSPTASGKEYIAGFELILIIIIAQVLLWSALIYRIYNKS